MRQYSEPLRQGSRKRGVRLQSGEKCYTRLERSTAIACGSIFRRQRKIQEELAKQQEIETERRQKELEMLAQQMRKEEEKIKALDGWVANWIRAGQTRSFIDALERVWAEQGHDLSPEAAKGQRLAWMKRQADRLDPMIPSPPSIIDRKSELPHW